MYMKKKLYMCVNCFVRGYDVFFRLSVLILFGKKLLAILLEQNCQAYKLRLISRTNMPLELYLVIYNRTHQKQITQRINNKMNRGNI